jgi:hypothetical protein
MKTIELDYDYSTLETFMMDVNYFIRLDNGDNNYTIIEIIELEDKIIVEYE